MVSNSKSQDEIFIRRKGCNTPSVKLAFALAFHEE
jgi:hypothetical protein